MTDTAQPGELKTTPFDVVEYLDSEEMIAEYLTAALESGDMNHFLNALQDASRAMGMTQLAEKTGLGRESLYKALRPGAEPRFGTIFKVCQALGVHMAFTPSHNGHAMA